MSGRFRGSPAVVHQISAHGVVQLHHESNFELGADAIDARNQHRLAIELLVDGEQPAKSTDIADHAAGKGLVRKIFDALLGAVRAVDVNPAVGVGDRSGFQCRGSVSVCWVNKDSSKKALAAN